MKPFLLKQSAIDGFTLVEMAIVLFIVALLLGGLLPTISGQIEQQRNNETRKQLDEMKQALIGFAVINGRLPCPANGLLASGDELTTGSGQALTCNLTDGVLPWATLALSETDAWGRRFTYHVNENFADGADGTATADCSQTVGVSFQICSDATLDVKDASAGSNVAADVPAVVVSHGKNGLGAYPYKGGTKIGTATGDENENSDGDITFVSKDFSPTFDDVVVWVSPNILINRMVTAGRLP